ncbi:MULTISPECIES: glucosidase [Acidithrix]|uniref:Mannosyl oligosaccharide glucosidase n=1 Tax=Acidithrix ferrooxidans TaxID=1280514 RepID=A0A0D8HDV3_9ACTN|nr:MULTISPECIES: glucosidase [Acidithrix]KJF15962.1 mannosyl oligosaccharide glucosidase [Acidithrix ferrooxidans]CAG4934845.1 unnamed protein product [Acidithrix sp. C25]
MDRKAKLRRTTEYERLGSEYVDVSQWRKWGPYLAERAWGTVREDYSSNGDSWNYFPFEEALSRAYRWNEDGLGGICDIEQNLCLGLAFWNEKDPFLKERLFGLTNSQGNHGEDVKERYWYIDSTPSHSWMHFRYHYPQQPFPYQELLEENQRRSRDEAEYEIEDTHIFDDDKFWEIDVVYAKESPGIIAFEISARNCSSESATLHILPSIWFRDTWSWRVEAQKPSLSLDGDTIVSSHPRLGTSYLKGDGEYKALFCDNESNNERLFGSASTTQYPKDAINDYVVTGATTTNPANTGTKAALHYLREVEAGQTTVVRVVFSHGEESPIDLSDDFSDLLVKRRAEADEFYGALSPKATSSEEASIMRQAFAGMLWSKQFYHFDVERWIDGDPGQPSPPDERSSGRNASWRHFHALDVISMPDTWEYPWFAAWDLAFHCITLSHVDAAFAKRQLILMCREWYMHPSGALPAYEWAFDDANPPVHAWAALRVFEIDGDDDYDFLERVFHKLLINFTWWVNRKDTEGNNVFQGGFLGLDNIGPFNRSDLPPTLGRLEQSDGTAWMAFYSLSMLDIALVLAEHDDTYEDVATKFFEHFAYIAAAMDAQGLWNEEDGFYFDIVRFADGGSQPLRAFSMVGLIAMCAVTILEPEVSSLVPQFTRRLNWFINNKPQYSGAISYSINDDDQKRILLSVVSPERLCRILGRVLDEDEFLSPHGIRALSKYHKDNPLHLNLGNVEARLDYEPGESSSPLFGGNSNWRGPVWFPLNYLVIEALSRFGSFCGDQVKIEYPSGSGNNATLAQVSNALTKRLTSLFQIDESGSRPAMPKIKSQYLYFHEYFNGDTGEGLGASHQTGWTGLIGDLIIRSGDSNNSQI